MKSVPGIRVRTVALFLILLPAAVGVVAVHASPTCESFVRTYITTPVRNRVSKATAAAWAQWRVGHPKWKPNPKLKRAKYVMTREESVKMVDFACEVPTQPATLDMALTPSEVEGPLPVVELPPMYATQIGFPSALPPNVAEVTPATPAAPATPGVIWPPFAPYIPPILGSVPTGSKPVQPVTTPLVPPVVTVPVVPPVPEPPSILLAGLGVACLGYLLSARDRRARRNC